jgi:hypothetical protein
LDDSARDSRGLQKLKKVQIVFQEISENLAVGSKFASFLKQACQRLGRWLSQTAPQLNLTMEKFPPWLLFAPRQASSSAVT